MYPIKSNFRSEICKVSLEENQNVDYVYVIRNAARDAVPANSMPLEVTETTVECNLDQRQSTRVGEIHACPKIGYYISPK